jgi:hypothetical protein
MELGSYFLFLQAQIKDIIIIIGVFGGEEEEGDDDVFYLYLQKQKSAQSYTPRVLPTIRGCLEGLAPMT